MLNDAVKEDIRNSVLCWLATADDEGQPNVSPKEIFCDYGDDSVVIAEIASPVSARNVVQNPRVCVSFVDVFRQRGFKLLGHARLLLPKDSEFHRKGARLLDMAGKDFKVRGVFHVMITRVERIWAPSYSLFPNRTAEEQMANSYRTYGVKPTNDP